MAGGAIAVWLYGINVAGVEEYRRQRFRLTYTDIAEIVQTAVSKRGALDELLRATASNVLVGNGDAHSKNFSLLHHDNGELELSPLYDLLATLTYGLDRLAMFIDSVQRIDRVTNERLVNEATRWGMDRSHATGVIQDVVNRVAVAVQKASDEVPGVPREMPRLVQQQAATLS